MTDDMKKSYEHFTFGEAGVLLIHPFGDVLIRLLVIGARERCLPVDELIAQHAACPRVGHVAVRLLGQHLGWQVVCVELGVRHMV